jgi:hypothetical protein
MLKVNVGLSRKISQDYNSTGFSVNLEGEIAAPIDDPEQVIERIREYYDVAEAALHDQIDRHQSESAIASRDAEGSNGSTVRQPPAVQDGRDADPDRVEPATAKQLKYLQSLARRQGLSAKDLEARIGDVLDRRYRPEELSKRQAGVVIDALAQGGAGEARPARRS